METTTRLRCPDCKRRNVEVMQGRVGCETPKCNFWAFFAGRVTDRDRAQMHRLREANPGAEIETTAGQTAMGLE